jgi:hypothetical protein
MQTCEECLKEADECDRLARLARSPATRRIMTLAALQWRKLAEKAEEREMRSGLSRR